MPGPNWKRTVGNLDADAERILRRAEDLTRDERTCFRDEVYKNGNTVVEVSVKTRKSKRAEEGRSGASSLPARSAPSVRTTMKPRKIVEHRPASTAASATWNRALLRQEGSRQPSNVNEKVDESCKEKINMKPLQLDETDEGGKKKKRGVFRSRTLQVFVNEMRAALKGNSVDTREMRAILDDLEFVSLNMRESDASASLLQAKEKDERPDPRVLELSTALTESKKKCELQEKQISDLKLAVTRLSANNSEMMALLSKNVDSADSLRKLKEENAILELSLKKEKTTVVAVRSDIEAKGQENQELRKVIFDLQLSLSRDLQMYASRQPPLLPNISSAVSDDRVDETWSEGDSAIEEGSSHPSSRSRATVEQQKAATDDSALAKTGNIISDAKNMLEEAVKQSAAKAAMESEKRINTEKQVLSTITPNVHEFLNRMRNQKSLDITMPKLPPSKQFDASMIELTGLTDANSSVASLTESKFRHGLEKSILLTSDAE